MTICTSRHRFQPGFEGIYALVKDFNTLMMNIRGKQIPILYAPLEVHGKMLTIRDGEKRIAMVTTNNLTEKGVVMGTAEIALLSSNPDFLKSCRAFLEKVRGVSRTSE